MMTQKEFEKKVFDEVVAHDLKGFDLEDIKQYFKDNQELIKKHYEQGVERFNKTHDEKLAFNAPFNTLCDYIRMDF